jgi:hypothetical protein
MGAGAGFYLDAPGAFAGIDEEVVAVAVSVGLGYDEAFAGGFYHEHHFRQFSELLAGSVGPRGIDNFPGTFVKRSTVWVRLWATYTFPVARQHTHTAAHTQLLQFSHCSDDPGLSRNTNGAGQKAYAVVFLDSIYSGYQIGGGKWDTSRWFILLSESIV